MIEPMPRIVVPARPEPPPPPGVPVIAVLSPVLASLAMWMVTRSPMALLFALLGPAIAFASMADARWRARRRRRKDAATAAREHARIAEEIAAAHDRERAALWRRHPGAGPALDARAHDPRRWHSAGGEQVVVVGRGSRRSSLVLEGAPNDELRSLADTIDGAPVTTSAARGVAVIGAPAAARGLVRSLALQALHELAPDAVTVRAGSVHRAWLERMPHPLLGTADDPESVAAESADGSVLARFTAREHADALLEHAVLVHLHPHPHAVAAVVVDVADDHPTPVVPRFVSESAAREAATALAELAQASGRHQASLPQRVELAALPARTRPGGLGAVIGVVPAGVLEVDLVRDGPHALVAGASGSGKSELLVSWVLAMAEGRSTDEVTFLLVDFKGGAAFAPLLGLPHCVGVITDLDPATAERALASLRAELEHRERELASRGCRSIDDRGHALARLVVVVDEYAAMIAELPGMAPLIGDIAARGRSLGVHLVLCTQRPSGIVHEGVLANTGLRICLRVTSPGDSSAVIGRPDAARLAQSAVGRACLGDGRAAQLAIAAAHDTARVSATAPQATRPVRRPWCPPLPVEVTAADVEAARLIAPGPPVVDRGMAFGLIDVPERQRHEVATYEPQSDGNLLVVGGVRSGRSGVLAALAAAQGRGQVAAGVEQAWDLVERAVDGRSESADDGARLLLIDDIDAVCDRLDDDHRHVFLRRVAMLAGAGAGTGAGAMPTLRLVVTARRVSGALQSLLPLFEARLPLRLADRQEHVLAGGTAALHDAALPPGAGEWRGYRVQVVLAPPQPPSPVARPLFVPDPERDHMVVSRTPSRTVDHLQRQVRHEVRELGGPGDPATLDVRVEVGARRRIIVADPDRWQLEWGAFSALRRSHELIVHGVSGSELRALTRDRSLLPPFEPGADAAWLCPVGEAPRRIRLS